MSNYVPNEVITINDKDPSWINKKIKSLNHNKIEFFRKSFKKNNEASIRQLEQMQESLHQKIEIAKQFFYSRLSNKLSSNKINPTKCYWSILKTFLTNKKIPCIPPLIHNNKFVTDFKEKSELFNSFFAKQCSLIENASTLPYEVLLRTDKSLNNIIFSEEDILKVIRRLRS